MTDPPSESDAPDFDPGSMATASFGGAKAIWYKRPWVLVTVAVVLVVAVSVISDLPHHISSSQDASDQNAAMHQINYDLKTCDFAVKEAFNFYRLDLNRKIPSANYTMVLKTLLPEDEVNCSFATGPLVDMTGNLQIADTTAGKQIEAVRLAVVHWVAHDAQYAIKDIIYLFTHPGDAKTLHNLSVEQNYLAQDRQAALGSLSNANNILGTTLANLNLPVLARLPGT